MMDKGVCCLVLILSAAGIWGSDDPMDNFRLSPGRSSTLNSPSTVSYCRPGDKWLCAEYIDNTEIELSYTCSLDKETVLQQNSSHRGLARIEVYRYNNPEMVSSTVCQDPWSACTHQSTIKEQQDEHTLIYQIKGLDFDGNIQCMDMLKLRLRYPLEVSSVTWVDDETWYEVDGDILYFGPSAQAYSFPSPLYYTITTDDGSVLLNMSTAEQSHISYRVEKEELDGVSILTLTAESAQYQTIQRSLNVSQIFPPTFPMASTELKDSPLLWMILTGVIGFVLIAYLVIVIYCKRKTLCGRKNTEQPPPPSPAHADSGDTDQESPAPANAININITNNMNGDNTSAHIAQGELASIPQGENAPPSTASTDLRSTGFTHMQDDNNHIVPSTDGLPEPAEHEMEQQKPIDDGVSDGEESDEDSLLLQRHSAKSSASSIQRDRLSNRPSSNAGSHRSQRNSDIELDAHL